MAVHRGLQDPPDRPPGDAQICGDTGLVQALSEPGNLILEGCREARAGLRPADSFGQHLLATSTLDSAHRALQIAGAVEDIEVAPTARPPRLFDWALVAAARAPWPAPRPDLHDQAAGIVNLDSDDGETREAEAPPESTRDAHRLRLAVALDTRILPEVGAPTSPSSFAPPAVSCTAAARPPQRPPPKASGAPFFWLSSRRGGCKWTANLTQGPSSG